MDHSFSPVPRVRRFDGEVFRITLDRHLARWSFLTLLVTGAAMGFHAHYAIGLNVTASLPYRLFLIHNDHDGDHFGHDGVH